MEKLSFEVNRLNNVLRKKVNDLEELKKKVGMQELLETNLNTVEREAE